MSKEELMKIQTCVLKVNIHCDGCKQKVKKILQKIEGVFTTKIDSEQGKVTVTGSVDPSVLIKKLAKSGKHAEIWGAPKANNNNQNQSQMANQFKGMQIDNGKGGGGGGKKGSNGGGGGGGGGGNSNVQKMGQQLNQQQMLQKMKGFQDLKLPPQLKGSVPPVNKNQKGVKFDVPEDEDDDDYSDEFDDEFSDEDEFDDDEFDDLPLPSNKMKPNLMMPNAHQQMVMNAQKNGNFGGGPVKNGGKGLPGGGGGGGGGKGGPSGGSGGKGGLSSGGGGKNQNQGGGKNGGKNGGNGDSGGGLNGGNKGNGGKNGGGGGGGGGLNGGNKGNGIKNGGGGGLNGGGGPLVGGFSGGFRPMGGGGPPPNMNMSMGGPMGMGNIPAIQGLPANSGPPGYFSGSGSDPMQQQQQYLTAVMNQQRAMGNERFQPMMYARPPPAVNYMPQNPHHYPNPYPYSYPYPYPPPYGNDQYSHAFSDENTSSCDIM